MKYKDFSFYLKIISSLLTVKTLLLSSMSEDIGVTKVTNMINQLQESFPTRHTASSFQIHSQNGFFKIPYLPVYKSTFYNLKICPKNRPRLIHGSKTEIKKVQDKLP